MAEHAPDTASASDRYYFLIRRLHSLSGLIPLGVFLCLHLGANATILVGGAAPGGEFQRSVDRIHALGPLLVPVEIVGIFIPLAFHALLGFQILFSGRSNAQDYPYAGNIRYTLQRVTAVIAFFFIVFHLWQLHWVGAVFGGGAFAVHDAGGNPAAARTTADALQSAWWVAPIYAIGIVSVVYHLANGVWTSLITWGITIRPQAQRTAGYACAVFGVLLCLVGLGALRGFRTFEPGEQAGAAPHVTQAADRPK